MSARDAFTVVVLRNNGQERLLLTRSPEELTIMIPNPVQRRRIDPPRPTDSMIEPCAQEGGTFRVPGRGQPANPEDQRPAPIPEWSLPTWVCGLIVLATCAACAWLGAS